jgi:PEP-CTERM motif
MKKLVALGLAAAAMAYSPAASAANFLPGGPNFQVFGNPLTGLEPVTGAITNTVNAAGSYTDNFFFQIGPVTGAPIGLGSGSITTTFTGPSDQLTFTSVLFNNGFSNFVLPISVISGGAGGSLAGIPVYSGLVNTLTVNYTTPAPLTGYSGRLRYTPGGIPEPMTWMMMILGFGAVGFALRRRRDQDVRVRYAM